MAPRSPVEEALARIWSEVLKLEQVGIHDNFFDLGGHSLLATQVIARVINTFRVELSLRSFFEAPTVAGLAEVITQKQVANDGPEDLDRMLTEVEALSDEEAQQLLTDERGKDDI